MAKATKLLMLLEGEALAVWLELTTEQKEIQLVVIPMGFVSLDEFHQRKLHPGEAILVFIHNLKKLLGIAVPSLNKEAKDPLLLHQVRGQLARSYNTAVMSVRRSKTLESVRLLMAVDSQPVATIIEPINGSSEVQQLKDQVTALTEQVALLATRQRGTNQPKARNRPHCFSRNQF